MTYGAPTNLDLSACIVSSDGGNTTQTLAQVSAVMIQNASAVATAQQDATDAKNAVAGIDNAYIPVSAYGAANGVLKTDATGQFVGGANVGGHTWMRLGYVLNADGSTVPDTGCGMIHDVRTIMDGTTALQAGFYTWGTKGTVYQAVDVGANGALHPNTDGQGQLGMAGHAWANIYSKTAVQVTSDMAMKTLIGQVGADTFAEAAKLADAIAGIATIGFKLNDAIAAKGADGARIHFGYSAQDVWGAITDAGLDPSKYALITKSPLYDVQDVATGGKNADGTDKTTRTCTPLLGADNEPVYRLMLRYEQIYSLLIWRQGAHQSAIEARLAALEAKVGA